MLYRVLAVVCVLSLLLVAGCIEVGEHRGSSPPPPPAATPPPGATPAERQPLTNASAGVEAQLLPLYLDILQRIAPPLTVVDDFGRGVTVRGSERIVSLAPSNTEILFALGVGDRVVGVTEYCDFPEEAAEREKVGGVATVDVEKVVALRPDVVFGCELNGKETFDRLESLGVSVVGINPQNISHILEDILLIGEIVGAEENASALVAEMQVRIEAIRSKVAGAPTPKVAHVCWHDPLWVAGAGTFQHELIELAGGENVFSDFEDWKSVSLEEFIRRNPEVIVVSVGHGAEGWAPYEFITHDERLRTVDAVRNGRVYPIDADIIARAGPRIVDALEELARDIHPELFEAAA
ncbi:MAG TPA: ABC transporter substrate-binding protein [Methanomicrobia archaeon]|nr:ABC transporter substrate-binding protein [Methanomicrobia archaeon]HEX59502.1 ABC transporter substrate-binding protein [Methanomicrobia archaeon]